MFRWANRDFRRSNSAQVEGALQPFLDFAKDFLRIGTKNMGNYENRHHFRLDEPTEHALEQICHLTLMPKSVLMRKYVQEGAARDIQSLTFRVANVLKNTVELKTPSGSN